MELLTVDEVAKLLRISSISVRRYVAAGSLPAVRVGRSVRIDKAAVEQFATQVPRHASAEGHIFTFDSPLWDLVAIVEDGPTDLAESTTPTWLMPTATFTPDDAAPQHDPIQPL